MYRRAPWCVSDSDVKERGTDMNRRRIACLAAALASLALLAPGGSAATAADSRDAAVVEPGLYTVEEAEVLGLETPDTPDAYGLPTCKVDLEYKGEPEDADKAVDIDASEPAACAVDPSRGTVAVGWPTPHYGPEPPEGAGYHWLGYNTNKWEFAGGKIEVEVRDPDVNHCSGCPWQFVGNRVLAHRENGDWIEIGWIEISSEPNERKVYTYNDGQYYHPANHPLTDGSFYSFRSVNCTVGGDDRQCVDIWWGGQWERLDNDASADCRGAAGGARCRMEEYTEVYTEGNGHPDLTGAPAGNRIDFRDTELRTDAGNWISWTRPSTKGGPYDVYETCGINDFYRFYSKKPGC